MEFDPSPEMLTAVKRSEGLRSQLYDMTRRCYYQDCRAAGSRESWAWGQVYGYREQQENEHGI